MPSVHACNRITFRAAFTTAEGWGRFSQTVEDGKQKNAIELHYGKLHLKQLTLDHAPGVQAGNAVFKLDGQPVDAQLQIDGPRTVIQFTQGLEVATGQTLQVKV